MCSEIRDIRMSHVTKAWKRVTVLGTQHRHTGLSFSCFCLFVHNNILWMAPLSCHNVFHLSLFTLGNIFNYQGAILLGLGPCFPLLGASLVIWQQYTVSSTFVCSCGANYRSLCSGKCWQCHILQFCLLTPLHVPPIGQSVPVSTQKDVQCLLHGETASLLLIFWPLVLLGAIIVVYFAFYGMFPFYLLMQRRAMKRQCLLHEETASFLLIFQALLLLGVIIVISFHFLWCTFTHFIDLPPFIIII